MSKDSLKPCPFCGHAARLCECDDEKKLCTIVVCTNCGAENCDAEMWNTRTNNREETK